MSIGIRYILDIRRKKKDGTHALRLRITINRKSFEIGSGYSLSIKSWNSEKQCVRNSAKEFKNVGRINNLLSSRKAEALDKLTKLDEEGRLQSTSFNELKSILNGRNTESTTFVFIQSIIDELLEMEKIGNARVYDMVLRSMKTFSNDKDFSLDQITYSWLEKYEIWYLSRTNSTGKKNTINGLGVNMRTIRAVINRAIKRGLLKAEQYPFKNYTIKKVKTKKRAISKEDLVKLINCEPKTERQRRSKVWFLISFKLMGASFVDLAFLRHRNINGNRIEYKRKKTGGLYSIKISDGLKNLLDPYLVGEHNPNDFILPIIDNNSPLKDQYRQARNEMRRYNKALKELGKMAEISTSQLSSLVSRHTYATLARYSGMPVALISEALGHSTEKVTQIYLDSFSKDYLDEWNEKVIELGAM